MAGVNYVTFNQDHSLLAVATTRGLRVYNTDPFELTNHSYEDDISLLEQLFSTSLVAMVLTPRLLRIVNTKKHSTICELTFHGMVVAVKMNRKRLVVMLEEVLFIYDISNMKLLHQQLTPLNPSGIVALSPNSENNFLAIPHYQKTPNSPQQTASHLPKSVAKEPINGDVLLYDLNKMEEVTVISAHQAPLSCVAINSEGTLLATSSEKGTVIRIFSIPQGKKLYQFRRGSMPARIFCMSFNATSTLLCVSSATETVHIFKLSPPAEKKTVDNNNTNTNDNNGGSAQHAHSPPTSPLEPRFDRLPANPSATAEETPPHAPPPSYDLTDSTTSTLPGDPSALPHARQPRQPGFMSLLRRTSQGVSTSLVSRAAGYLPSSVTEMWEPERDFAWVRLPKGGGGQSGQQQQQQGQGQGIGGQQGGGQVRCVVALANHGPQVMVATAEGEFLVYAVDFEKGGQGVLVKRFDDIHGLKHRKGNDGED